MEVLQTSALPLGDGALWKLDVQTNGVAPGGCPALSTAGEWNGDVCHCIHFLRVLASRASEPTRTERRVEARRE